MLLLIYWPLFIMILRRACSYLSSLTTQVRTRLASPCGRARHCFIPSIILVYRNNNTRLTIYREEDQDGGGCCSERNTTHAIGTSRSSLSIRKYSDAAAVHSEEEEPSLQHLLLVA